MPESVLYGNDYRALAVAYRQINRVREIIAPPVLVAKTYERDCHGRHGDDAISDHPYYAHPDLADMPAARAMLAHRRKARDDFKSGQAITPYPVYVATMPGGEVLRLSFYSRAGKPLDIAAGYNACMIIGRALPVAGHVEHEGREIADPFFATSAEREPVKLRKETPAKRLAAICKALNEGEIEAAMMMARAA